MIKSEIIWKLRLSSPREQVFKFINSNEGREAFWAENAKEEDGYIHFEFINGYKYAAKILERNEPSIFKIEYFRSVASFELRENEKGGTDLTLLNTEIPEEEYMENYAGWVSLLMTMKAAVDFQVDLRNHDPKRTWNEGFVEN